MRSDLKPQNILLDRGGRRALITDFGIAKPKERTFLSTANVGAGTVAYMARPSGWWACAALHRQRARSRSQAPELFGGGVVDEKCDQYSFAIVLWECVTGERPWAGRAAMQIVMSVGTSRRRAAGPPPRAGLGGGSPRPDRSMGKAVGLLPRDLPS